MARKISSRSSKVFSVIEGILIAIFILIIAVMLFLYFTFSDVGAAPTIFGHVVYKTQAVNMQPDINKGDAVIGKASAVPDAKAGDIVICRIKGAENGEERIVVARIDSLLNENGALYYNIRFNTAASTDVHKIQINEIIAADVKKNVSLGKLLTFATSDLGILLIIIIPSFIIIVLQILKIVHARQHKEESVNLYDLNSIMNSDDYPEEAFLPISQTPYASPERPEMGTEANEFAFVPDKPTSPILEDAPADLDSEKSVSFAGPTAADIFAEDEAFFAEKPQKESFNIFDGGDLPQPAEPEKPAALLGENPMLQRDAELAREFYGITEEVRSHQEERRLREAAQGGAFQDPFDSKADSILSGIDDTIISDDSADAEPDTEQYEDVPAPVPAPAPVPESITEYTPEEAVYTEPAPVPDIFDATPAVTYDEAAEPVTAETTAEVFPEQTDESFTASDAGFDLFADIPAPAETSAEPDVTDIPVRGTDTEEPAPRAVKVRKVVKKKKVSVDDLLSIIDEEENKLNS